MKNCIVIFIFFSIFSFAQEGTVRGDVFDMASGEPVKGLVVKTIGGNQTAITDLDGKFSIDLPVGRHDLVIKDDLYETVDFPSLEVKENEVNYLGEIFAMEKLAGAESGKSIALKGLTVQAKQAKNSETALLMMKKNSVKIMDGISSAKMQLTGDATAVDAAKRVTGVSVEGGKYVYIRGLGDRYSKTTLNGMDVPGLDPDKNTIQMDIFPTSLIDNVMVSKNFTAEQSADFTGGIMNIETKDFPNKKFMTLSLGVSYNPSMNLVNNYLDYDGGKLDFLGFDDGTRALPDGVGKGNLTPEMTRNFNKILGGTERTSFLDYNFSFSMGNQIGLKNTHKLGYVFSLAYKNTYRYYEDALFASFQKMIDISDTNLDREFIRAGKFGKNNVMLGVLGGVSYKTLSSKYRLNLMHLQNGERTTGRFDIDSRDERGIKSDYKAVGYNLEYNQRSLTNASLAGEHVLNNDWKVNWALSPSFSKSEDPDIRNTLFSIAANGNLYFAPGEGGYPTRTWRYLDEFNGVSKLDITKKYELFNKDAKLKTGVSYIYKNRDYKIIDFTLSSSSTKPIYWKGDPNEVLSDSFIYPNTSFYYKKNEYPNGMNPNAYKASSGNMASYISNEFYVSEKLKAILGLRLEAFSLYHTGRSVDGATGTNPKQVLNNIEVLNTIDLFPSANLIYFFTKDQNLRFSYSRTTARPSFKEMSFAQIYDPLTGRTFSGGLLPLGLWDGNLKPTYITNLDLRWEYFMPKGQLFSVSTFYKNFKNPIELVMASISNFIELQPQNVGDSKVYGVELEARKSLDFIFSSLEYFSLNSNITYAKSELHMSEEEYGARNNNKRKEESLKKTRQMAGQAPYIINAGVVYSNPKIEVEAGLFYNVKGPTIYSVGGDGLHPDEYEKPFHNLSFSISKNWGGNKSIDLKISNLLGERRERYFEAYNSPQGKSYSISPGRAFSLGFKYKF